MRQRRKHFLIAGTYKIRTNINDAAIHFGLQNLFVYTVMRTYNNGQREDCNRMDFATLVKNHNTAMIILNPNDKYEHYRQYYSSSSGLYLVVKYIIIRISKT